MKTTEYNFFALTPKDDTQIGIYENAVDFVFAHDKVLNVAISGSYGSGKSSVLASYKKKHSDKKFLHISLAHFRAKDDNEVISEEGEKTSTETMLEGKILNQLLHQISPDKIPCTQFRVKKETSKGRNIKMTVLATVCCMLGLYSFLFTKWTSFIQSLTIGWLNKGLAFTGYAESRLVAGLGFFAIAGIFVYHFIKLQESRHIIKKADVKGVEIEIFEDSNDSYFDKYLNEVLYLFANAEADVIVFEDIDRYESGVIFERLHEINTLVNNNRKGKPLRFFYLMRDDIFVTKDRTKFFDFIIPIVPVVDSSNSYDKFLECFEKSGLIGKNKEILNHEFLQGLSLYIDDMRILQNICNEFLIYYGRLLTTEQDPNKMLGLIAFKNLFPRDFSDLQFGRGFMYEIIGGNGKEQLIAAEQTRLQKSIEGKKIELANVKNEELFSDEITVLYYYKLYIAMRASGYQLQPSDKPDTCKEQLAQYRNLRKHQTIFNEYDQRLKDSSESSEKRNDRIVKIETEISQAERDLEKIHSLRLKDIITRKNVVNLFKAKFTSETGEVEEFSQLKDSPYFDLLKYLVWEGYIDETYSDYMTYFYENSLSRNDKIFLRSVTDKKVKEPTYPLDNSQMVISRLPLQYFGQEETLNYALFACLLLDFSTTRSAVEKAKQLIQQIIQNRRFDFILDYSEQTNQIGNLVKTFGAEWPSFIGDYFVAMSIDNAPNSPKTKGEIFIQKYAYAFLTLVGEDAKKLSFFDERSTETLKTYLSCDADFLSTNECNDKKVALGIQRFGVMFESLNAERAYRPLLEQVYSKNLYVINYGNIKTMLESFYPESSTSNLQTANYSAVMVKAESPLAQYVNANINNYMSVILDECGSSITDTAENVLLLLNNDDVEQEKKLQYISYLQTAIIAITDVDDTDLWHAILRNPLAIEYTATNVIAYVDEFCEGIFSETLANYINGKKEMISFADLFEDDDKRKAFFRIIIRSSSLSNHIYKEYLKQFNLHYSKFSIAGLPLDKLAILDELGKINMSAESLAFIREHYNDYLIMFAAKHISEYIEIVAGQCFHDETLKLLDQEISDTNRLALLKWIRTLYLSRRNIIQIP